MQLVRGTCVSRLKRGEYKRIPRAQAHKPVGFYFSCPYCGQLRTVSTSHVRDDGTIVEEDSAGKLVTLTPPLKCIRCGRSFAVKDGAYV